MNNLKIMLAASQDWTKECFSPISNYLPELQAELNQKSFLKWDYLRHIIQVCLVSFLEVLESSGKYQMLHTYSRTQW